MKKIIYYLSIIIILTSTVILNRVVFSQQNDVIIKVFNNSINFALKGNYQKAIDELIGIYKDYSNNYLVNLRLGYLFYLQKNYDESIKYYQKAIVLSRDKAVEPFLGLTLPLAAKEKWNDVELIYNKVLSIDPNNFTANLRLGQIYFNRKEYSKAEKLLLKSFEQFPSEYEPNLYLGWTYFYLNKKSEAKKHFINVLMVSENDKSAQEGLKLAK